MNNNVALITDQHFGIKKNSEIFFNSQLKFYTEQFVPYLKEQQIDTIIFLGDLFDNRSSINVKIKTDVFNLFEQHLSDFKIFMLVGNHDTYFNNTVLVNSLKFFSKFKNIEVIEQPTLVTIKNRTSLLLPWITDNNELYSKISTMKFDVCFGHLDFIGFAMNKSRVNEHGISPEIFLNNNCKKIFSGHFHTRSKKDYNGLEVQYIGNPYQTNRGDIDEERGFTVLDMDNLEYSFVDNTKSLKYKKIYFPELVDREVVENNIVDIFVNYDENNEDDVENYVAEIEKLNPILPPNIFVINKEIIENQNFKIDDLSISSIPDITRTYIDTLEIENKDEVYNFLIELYNQLKVTEKEM